MADIQHLLDELIEREGGYIDHPADRGGPTNWGITEQVARAHGYRGEMCALPRPLAEHIYLVKYWQQPGFDKTAMIAPSIAAELFDTGVNMGPQVAIGFLQRALNALNRNGRDYADIAVDRQLGPVTLAALEHYILSRGRKGEAVLLKAMEALQGERYITLAEARPANEAFLYGWMANRIS